MNRKPGDWNCRSCNHLNFTRRDSCHRCGDPKPLSVDFHPGGGGGGGEFRIFAGRGGGGGGGSSFGFVAGPDVRPGDWYCSCGGHNFASRTSCFKCGAVKEDSAVRYGGLEGDPTPRRIYCFGGGGGGGRAVGWKSGDWICNKPGCQEHNFASRTECFRCNAPRETGEQSLV